MVSSIEAVIPTDEPGAGKERRAHAPLSEHCRRSFPWRRAEFRAGNRNQDGFARADARDYPRRGVSVHPAATTPRSSKRQPASWKSASRHGAPCQPSRRSVKDDIVAGLIAFPCVPHSDDISGASFPIDGGWLARG
jgi:hypothetical protein